MKEWTVTWCKCPTNYNESRVAIVEAENMQDARKLLEDAIARLGISWWKYMDAWTEYKKPDCHGTVKTF